MVVIKCDQMGECYCTCVACRFSRVSGRDYHCEDHDEDCHRMCGQ